MNIMTDRLKLRMDELDLNDHSLAKRAGLHKDAVRNIFRSKSVNPRADTIVPLARTLRTSVEYLLGETDDPRPIGALVVAGESAQNAGSNYEDITAIRSVRVGAAMGAGAVIEHEAEGKPFYFRLSWIRQVLNATPDDLRVISGIGDSMEPTLKNRDVLMVHLRWNVALPEGIYALDDGGGLMVKRLARVPGSQPPKVLIISDNDSYPNYERPISDIRIFGRIVWLGRELL